MNTPTAPTATSAAVAALAARHCRPCARGEAALTREQALAGLQPLAPHWQLAADALSIHTEYRFADFYRTMSFVNALAHIANVEDHHPDLELGYNYCRVRFSTHTVHGLSDNDLICAAKTELLAPR